MHRALLAAAPPTYRTASPPSTARAAKYRRRAFVSREPNDEFTSPAHQVLTDEETAALFRENEMLQANNNDLTKRVTDLEEVVKRLWQRGRSAAPSPRDLRNLADEANQRAAQERRDAQEVRLEAQRNLRDLIAARETRTETQGRLDTVTAALDHEKAVASAWHASDAIDLTRQMAEMQARLVHAESKNAVLQADAEKSTADRSIEIGRLVAEMEGHRATAAAQLRKQREEVAELTMMLEATQGQALTLQSQGQEEQRTLRDEMARREELVGRTQESAAANAVHAGAQIEHLSLELGHKDAENERLRRELEESRDNFARLSARSREEQSNFQRETARLQGLVEKLGGEAAESRASLVSRFEELTMEREAANASLRAQLDESEKSRSEVTAKLTHTIDKLRWLQTKALSSGVVRPGRFRSLFYWESLKSAHADQSAISWRGDDDQTNMSQSVDLEHMKARASAEYYSERAAMAVHE